MTHYIDSWNKRLASVSAAHKAGRTIWFRRDEFFDEEFADQVPKWHVVRDRVENPERHGTYIWEALCGYKHGFSEILLTTPKLRIGSAPKVAERCVRCVNKLKKAKAAPVTTHHVTTKVGTAMTDQPVFTGTPDDWWEQAEQIMESEANNRSLGNWYITMMRTAGDTRPGYRIMTPSKPANTDNLIRDRGPHDKVSERVRLLIRGVSETPAWMTSVMVVADTKIGDVTERLPWIRKKSGRWQSLADGRLNINDHTMAELSPNPATITEDLI